MIDPQDAAMTARQRRVRNEIVVIAEHGLLPSRIQWK